jgi:hypothetical protein
MILVAFLIGAVLGTCVALFLYSLLFVSSDDRCSMAEHCVNRV